MKRKYILPGIVIGLFLVGLLAVGKYVLANPLFFPPAGRISSASTSPVYLRAGVASTTHTLNAHQIIQDSSVYQNPTAFYSLALAVHFTGSSTDSVLNIYPQYSADDIQGWYSYATSTSLLPVSYALTFASSTPGIGTTATTSRIFEIPVYSKFIRVVLDATGRNGAVWTEFISVKERAE